MAENQNRIHVKPSIKWIYYQKLGCKNFEENLNIYKFVSVATEILIINTFSFGAGTLDNKNTF